MEDLKSRNRTYLNGEAGAIDEVRVLRPGDQIRICEVTFVFQADTPIQVQLAPGKSADQ